MRISLALASLLALAAPAFADDLSGTWKRDDGRLIRLNHDAQSGEVTGKMLNPPPVDEAKKLFYAVDLALKFDGKKLEGKAIWKEPNPKAGASPDHWEAATRWELELVEPGKLKGRTEWIEWLQGNVSDRGFDDHSFERVPVVTIGSGGSAPEKVEAGAAIDDAALAGTWRMSNGTLVTLKSEGGAVTVERVKGEGPFPTIKLANEGNVLRGKASWPEGAETQVELALARPDRLQGRAERLEGSGAAAERGWAPLALEKLIRVDGGTPTTEPLPAASGGEVATFYKREDGLGLRLEKKGDGYEGELVAKDGPRAKVRLASEGGRLVGKATFTVDGAPVEATWELAPQADGSLEGRCEWLDVDPATKSPVARGMTARKFKAYRKLG